MSGRSFADLFSERSADYARFRPHYPRALYAALSEAAPSLEVAWDCATGNGQVATRLAEQFAQVIASEPSPQQRGLAPRIGNIRYTDWRAEERVPLATRSVDLITVAQALHWFDVGRFLTEALRVLKPGGIVAAWCYGLCRVNERVDLIVDEIYAQTRGYWAEGRRHIDEEYRNLPFPEPRLVLPTFTMTHEYSLEEYLGYLGTWSGLRAYVGAGHPNPLIGRYADFERAWGAQGHRPCSWPLTVLAHRARTDCHLAAL